MDSSFTFSAPGRTEICGNHTDHQHGCVLAAAINLDTTAEVRLNGGVLQIAWSPEDNHVYKAGPAEFVFDGEWPEA